MANQIGKTKSESYTRTAEQQAQDLEKRLAREKKRGGGGIAIKNQDTNLHISSSGTVATGSADDKEEQEEAESGDYLDGFEQSLGLFGDSSVANGQAGQVYRYESLRLHLPEVGGGSVKLMAHFVWNAALVMADYLKHDKRFDVSGKKVLEFGAGAGLPGFLCAKQQGAAFVTISDYPDPIIVQNLERNWRENIVGIRSNNTSSDNQQESKESRKVQEQSVRSAVRGHAWGDSVDELLSCLPPPLEFDSQGYDLILLADTLWMSDGHEDLLRSCVASLKRPSLSSSSATSNDAGGKIFVCCGLHTGYGTVRRFMETARSAPFNLKTQLVEIRRVPKWGETRTSEELAEENKSLKEEDLESSSVEDRNRTVLVYEITQ